VLDTAAELKKLVPGGTCLELRVHVPQHVSAGGAHSEAQETSSVLTVLRDIPGATKVEEVSPPEDEEGAQGIQVFRLYAEDAGSLVIGATQAVMEAGAEIRDLHIARPSLEDVFIYLTGRNLRS